MSKSFQMEAYILYSCLNYYDSMNTSKTSLKLQELFGIDLRSLALFRILAAVIVIVDLIQRMCDLEAFYTDSGIFPRTLSMNQYMISNNISLHLISGGAFVEAILFFIALAFAFADVFFAGCFLFFAIEFLLSHPLDV